jgi:hypothetical protein
MLKRFLTHRLNRFLNTKNNIMKLIKGQYYTVTGLEGENKIHLATLHIKFPQKCLFDGEYLMVKDKDGVCQYHTSSFVYKPINPSITISILPVKRKGETFYRYQFKSKNGEKLNDLFDSKGNASRGLKKFIKDIQENNFEII